MTEDGAETQPAAPSRDTLAASTLRALRAGRGNAGPTVPAHAPATDEPPADETTPEVADAEPVETEPVEAETVDAETGDAGVEDETAQPGPVALTKADKPAADVSTEPLVVEQAAAEETPASGEKAAAGETAAARPRRARLVTAACAVLAVAALVFAVVAGVLWWTAGHSQQHKLGVARVQVKKDAELAIITVNSADYRNPSAALSNWLDVSTGSLHSQFSQSRSTAIKLIARAKTVTKATVLDDAVTSLDLSKGTASVIASVNVTRTHNGSNSIVRNRYRATLTRVAGQWKLSNLTTVAVSLS